MNLAWFRQPRFRARVRRVDADGDDFWNFEAPLADDLESLSVPIGIGNQINGDGDAERSGTFQRLKILTERDALAMFQQPFLIDGLDPEKHIL